MTSLITQKDQIIAQMRAELSTTIEEDRYYTEENITDCNAHLEAFLAQLEKSLLLITQRKKKCLNSFGVFFTMAIR